jgi:hypothetical protein
VSDVDELVRAFVAALPVEQRAGLAFVLGIGLSEYAGHSHRAGLARQDVSAADALRAGLRSPSTHRVLPQGAGERQAGGHAPLTLVTLTEVTLPGTPARTLRHWCETGRVTARKIKGTWYAAREELERLSEMRNAG